MGQQVNIKFNQHLCDQCCKIAKDIYLITSPQHLYFTGINFMQKFTLLFYYIFRVNIEHFTLHLSNNFSFFADITYKIYKLPTNSS